MGILISIDDFGTGYSSLNYLKKFPVHKLKIDQSFINNAIQNPQDQAIVKAIISMGQSLGLTVCAEGIETLDQLEMLSLLECNLAQGYFISKPLPAQKVSAWYKSHEPIKPANSPFPIT
jgi:EAL domain-containing protein (putative c-di-GMP-specific phosphodiesterase class I)